MMNLYLIARHLERVGDRAKNIAEEVIYLVEGEIVRSTSDPH
jgi:phosphate transport system protein